MSDIALDRGLFLPDPFTDWYRERPFQIAFAVSVLLHALLIAFVPGLRSVQIEAPQVLNVEIVTPEEQRPIAQEHAPRVEPQPVQQPEAVRQPELAPPVHQVQPIERQITPPEPVVEPVVTPPEPVVPVQRAELAPPVPQEAPRPEPIALSRPDPMPEQRIEIPVEPRPVPQVQPVLPPPVARVEPQPEPQPRIEPRPEPQPQPIVEVPPPVQPVQRPAAPPVSQPKIVEPVIAPAPVQAPAAPTVTVRTQPPVTTPAPPVPAPAAVDSSFARQLTATYSQQISTQIKRQQRYPIVAVRRQWEGTAEVLLKISADGRVTEIALGKSSGRDLLDREALEMVRRASPLPQAPQQLRGRELSVTVPIIFRLQDS